MTCPLCGGKIVYVGAVSVECLGPATCQNSCRKDKDLDRSIADAILELASMTQPVQWHGGLLSWLPALAAKPPAD